MVVGALGLAIVRCKMWQLDAPLISIFVLVFSASSGNTLHNFKYNVRHIEPFPMITDGIFPSREIKTICQGSGNTVYILRQGGEPFHLERPNYLCGYKTR